MTNRCDGEAQHPLFKTGAFRQPLKLLDESDGTTDVAMPWRSSSFSDGSSILGCQVVAVSGEVGMADGIDQPLRRA